MSGSIPDFSRFAHKPDQCLVERSANFVQPPPKRQKQASSSNILDSSTVKGEIIGLGEIYAGNLQEERPLKLLIVGHNPSKQSWARGHYYANPSNRMWPLLVAAGIVPPGFTSESDVICPSELGIGFTDVASGVPETHSSELNDATLQSFKHSFYKRLLAHIERASEASKLSIEECYPRVIAFAGVRQWKALFPSRHFDSLKQQQTAAARKAQQGAPLSLGVSFQYKVSTAENTESKDTLEVPSSSRGVGYGVQTARPPGWPQQLRSSTVFLLPSSSGAAALTNAAREGPYHALGELLRQPELAWVSGRGLTCLPPLEANAPS